MFMLAITLSRHDFREVDQRIVLYTLTRGKIEVVARGIKKNISKNAPALEPFSLIDIELAPGRELTYLIKVHIIEQYIDIRTRLSSMFVGAAALKLVEHSVNIGEKDVALFQLLVSFLRFLNGAKDINPVVLNGFRLQLLQRLGFVPVLDQCVRCNKKRRASSRYIFAVNHGGLVCSACRNTEVNDTLLPLSASALEILQKLQQTNWSQINTITIEVKTQKMVEKVIEKFSFYHTNQLVPIGQGNAIFVQ
jgi:DNA repair protein RecO (recombination protein O)